MKEPIHFEEWLDDKVNALQLFAQEFRSNALAENFVGWSHPEEYFEKLFNEYVENLQ